MICRRIAKFLFLHGPGGHLQHNWPVEAVIYVEKEVQLTLVWEQMAGAIVILY